MTYATETCRHSPTHIWSITSLYLCSYMHELLVHSPPTTQLLRTSRVEMQTGKGTVAVEVAQHGALLRTILPDIYVPMERWWVVLSVWVGGRVGMLNQPCFVLSSVNCIIMWRQVTSAFEPAGIASTRARRPSRQTPHL